MTAPRPASGPAGTTPPSAGADPLASVAGLPGVAAAVEEARAAVDTLRGHRVLRRYAERVASESALRGARASAALEGVDRPLASLREAVWADATAGTGDPVVQGALRVAVEGPSLQETWGRAPLQVLARLHTLAAAGAVGGDQHDSLGRPAREAAPRLTALGEMLTAPTDAPALVVAAVVHGEVATMGAFPVGAGLVARAASRLTLAARGLDPTAVSIPEVGHLELGRDTYADALRKYAGGGPAGITAWVLHCSAAVVLGAREGLAVCESIQRGG